MADFTERTHRTWLADLRDEYRLAGLREENCDPNPILQFERWMEDARAAEIAAPNAMTLSTATQDGRPSARVVLLKDFGELGFVFYTNYTSRKARELEANPYAALTFYWAELARQVRIEGSVRRVSREQSASYFHSRPRGSQLGAWASHQSQLVSSREELEAKLMRVETKYGELDQIPAPDFWGGYCVYHEQIEFWQGQPDRLHDRLLYRRKGEDRWFIDRLSP